MRMLLLILAFLHGTLLVSSTSIVSPIVEVTARFNNKNNKPGHVIDNDAGTFYFSENNNQPEWLKLKLPEGSKVEKVVIINE